MTDRDPLAPIEALADDWAAKQRRNRERFVDGPIPMPKSPHLPPPETFEPVSELRTALAEARENVDRLTRWKAEALPVLDGLQEIGKALGLPLGAQITGPQALAAVEALVAERDGLTAVCDAKRPHDEAAAADPSRDGLASPR